MKISRYLSIFGFLLLSNTSQADQLFYGIALISQQLTQDVTVISTASTTTVKDTGSGLGFYADYYYKGSYRFNGTLSYVDYDDFNTISLTASADYLIPVDSRLTFFAGVSAGGAGMKFNSSSVSDMSLGTVYGLQAGAIAFLPNGLMLELGYRLRSANIETDIVNPTATSTVDELNETYLNFVIRF